MFRITFFVGLELFPRQKRQVPVSILLYHKRAELENTLVFKNIVLNLELTRYRENKKKYSVYR